MKKMELPIITVSPEIYHGLVTIEVNFFFKPNSSKIKSIFATNEPPEKIKIRNGYGANARHFTAEVKNHWPADEQKKYLIQIGPPQIPPQPQDIRRVSNEIAKALCISKKYYEVGKIKKFLKTDNELHARKVADLCKLSVKINKAWFKQPNKHFKFLVK